MNAVITFDLLESDNYQRAYDTLRALGFVPVLQRHMLPNTTVVGDDRGLLPAQMRDRAKAALEAASCDPTHIFVARISDWAMWGPQVSTGCDNFCRSDLSCFPHERMDEPCRTERRTRPSE